MRYFVNLIKDTVAGTNSFIARTEEKEERITIYVRSKLDQEKSMIKIDLPRHTHIATVLVYPHDISSSEHITFEMDTYRTEIKKVDDGFDIVVHDDEKDSTHCILKVRLNGCTFEGQKSIGYRRIAEEIVSGRRYSPPLKVFIAGKVDSAYYNRKQIFEMVWKRFPEFMPLILDNRKEFDPEVSLKYVAESDCLIFLYEPDWNWSYTEYKYAMDLNKNVVFMLHAKFNDTNVFHKFICRYSVPENGICSVSDVEDFSDKLNGWMDTLVRARTSVVKPINRISLSQRTQTEMQTTNKEDTPIIFLSHNSLNKDFGDALRDFIVGLGVKNDQLIYTSHPLHKVPLDKNFCDYMSENLHRNIFMIVLWSDTFLENSACLTEICTVGVLGKDFTNIFVPAFNYNNNPKFNEVVVDTKRTGIVLGGPNCKAAMLELKNKIKSMFNLAIREVDSMFLLDNFMDKINAIIACRKTMGQNTVVYPQPPSEPSPENRKMYVHGLQSPKVDTTISSVSVGQQYSSKLHVVGNLTDKVVFVIGEWGVKAGGVSSFNYDICPAMSSVLTKETKVVCLVLGVLSEVNKKNAANKNVGIIHYNKPFSKIQEGEYLDVVNKVRSLFPVNGKTIWIGHDIHTGPLAVALAKINNDESAVIIHTDYAAVEGYKKGSHEALKKISTQRQLIENANHVFAVGPRLKKQVVEPIRSGCTMIIPGLAQISDNTYRNVHSVMTYGRFSDRIGLLKQSELALAAFGKAVSQIISSRNDYKIKIVGLDRKDEDKAKQIVAKYAGSALSVIPHPYTEDRALLFNELKDNCAFMMLSITEGFGLSAWEAISAEVPLVLSDKSGVYDFLCVKLGRRRTDGYCVPMKIKGSLSDELNDDDVNAVAYVLRRIFEDPEDYRKNAKDLKNLLQDCTWEKCARDIANALRFVTLPSTPN